METAKKRKEVSLTPEVIKRLEVKAKLDGRNLKNYMEHVLIEESNEFIVTEEYKALIDKSLGDHQSGKKSYISLDKFKEKYNTLKDQ